MVTCGVCICARRMAREMLKLENRLRSVFLELNRAPNPRRVSFASTARRRTRTRTDTVRRHRAVARLSSFCSKKEKMHVSLSLSLSFSLSLSAHEGSFENIRRRASSSSECEIVRQGGRSLSLKKYLTVSYLCETQRGSRTCSSTRSSALGPRGRRFFASGFLQVVETSPRRPNDGSHVPVRVLWNLRTLSHRPLSANAQARESTLCTLSRERDARPVDVSSCKHTLGRGVCVVDVAAHVAGSGSFSTVRLAVNRGNKDKRGFPRARKRGRFSKGDPQVCAKKCARVRECERERVSEVAVSCVPNTGSKARVWASAGSSVSTAAHLCESRRKSRPRYVPFENLCPARAGSPSR